MLCPLTGIRAKSRSSRFRFSSCRCGANTVALGAMARKECDLVCKGRPRFTGVGGGEAASWKRCGVEDREVGPARNFGWSVHIYPPAILARQLRCISTETPPQISFPPPRRRRRRIHLASPQSPPPHRAHPPRRISSNRNHLVRHNHETCLPGSGSWALVPLLSSYGSPIFALAVTADLVMELQEQLGMSRRTCTDRCEQGRAALVALRRSGGGAGALGRGYYKGGFEPKMTRREAALILEMPYVDKSTQPTKSTRD